MPIFRIKDKGANQISLDVNHFKNEFALRDFFADNLEKLLGMRFLASEYPTTDGRIDTLAIDEVNSPVIIEYKWGQDNAIFVQGLFYLDWLKRNKSHFDLLVADKLGKSVKVNWTSPRVILVAQGFDYRTKIAVQQVDNVELIKYVPYEQDILYLENVYVPNRPRRFRSGVARAMAQDDSFDISFHLDKHKTTDEIREIFYRLQEKIKSLPEVEEVSNQKTGITYRTTKSFVRFEFGRTVMNVLVKSPKYSNDSRGLVEDITTHMWGYKGRIKTKSVKDVDDIFSIIQQSYQETL